MECKPGELGTHITVVGDLQSNSIILFDKEKKEGVIVDCGGDQGWNDKLFITHFLCNYCDQKKLLKK